MFWFDSSSQASCSPPAKSSSRESSLQRPKFFRYLSRITQGLRDFFAQEFAVALSEAMDRNADSSLIHIQVLCRIGVGNRVATNHEITFGLIKERGLRFSDTLIAQPGKHAFEQRERPFAIEEPVRAGWIGRVKMVALVRALPVQRKVRDLAASFLALRLVPFVG